ncbi:MAG: hypothetical protein HYR97_04685, partial [Candidatus Melainabacteria bacterium]|nr:hypothetical protein [Candidatus Melainabacteria bacterium]
PTGTMAQLCGTSWGPEPFNGIVFSRKVRDAWVKFSAPGFEEAMKKRNAWPQTEEEVQSLYEKINKNGKKVTGLEEVPEGVQKIFKINTEIDPVNYIEHLAAIQNGHGGLPECFNALSNTCMIKGDMSWEYAKETVMMAYKLGVKSVTFYPDGTRLSQPVEIQEKQEEEVKKLSKFLPVCDLSTLSSVSTQAKDKTTEEDIEIGHKKPKPRIRPKRLYGFNEEVLTPDGPIHIHVYFDDQGPRQVFAHLTRGGGVASGMIEAICRMATKALKWGCPPEDVADGLLNIQGGPKIIGVEANSIPDAIGKVLKEACKGQYQMSLFRDLTSDDEKDGSEVQTTLHAKHEIKFDERIENLDDTIRARMEWIAQGHSTHCPCCHAEFTSDSFGNPACKSGPVCLGCGWSHCG